jgi:hypothetical protein
LHGRPAALLDADQAALFEQLEAFTHHGPAEAEPLAKRVLGWQRRALGKSTADDLVRELLDDDRRQPNGALRALPALAKNRLRDHRDLRHGETS